MNLAWNEQVNLLLKTTDKKERGEIIKALKAKAAIPVSADTAANGKLKNHLNCTTSREVCKHECF